MKACYSFSREQPEAVDVINDLVKADPNRFEMVNTPDHWEGIDY
jgi:hypothetical protein